MAVNRRTPADKSRSSSLPRGQSISTINSSNLNSTLPRGQYVPPASNTDNLQGPGRLPPVVVPVGANPTAVAGPAAINGVSPDFMRSDAAPAVQIGSNSQKGLLQVDGVTITAAAGIISAVVSNLWNPCVSLYDRKPNAGEILFDLTITYATNLPINLTGSIGGINTSLDGATAATSNAVFTLYKNGASIGTVTIPAGTTGRNIATFSFASAVSFAINDSLQFQAPVIQDATLQGVSFSFLGTK